MASRSSPTFSQVCKLGDEQTIVSAEAVYRAVESAKWQDKNLEDWGIVSAPQFLGRIRIAAAVERFRKQDVRGASPRHIPTVSQHSVAGTLSVLFSCRGPCFGAGGSQGSIRDAFTTAVSLVSSGMTPGFWITVSQWSPEALPDAADEQNAAAECHAVAMAIVPSTPSSRPTTHQPESLGDSDHNHFGFPQNTEIPASSFEIGLRFQPTLSSSETEPRITELIEFLSTSLDDRSSWGRTLAPGLWLGVRRQRSASPIALPRVA